MSQIDEVRTLIDQFAAAGNFGTEAPFLFIADTSAVAVTAADKHQRTEIARLHDSARLLHGRMEAMIVADLDHATFAP